MRGSSRYFHGRRPKSTGVEHGSVLHVYLKRALGKTPQVLISGLVPAQVSWGLPNTGAPAEKGKPWKTRHSKTGFAPDFFEECSNLERRIPVMLALESSTSHRS